MARIEYISNCQKPAITGFTPGTAPIRRDMTIEAGFSFELSTTIEVVAVARWQLSSNTQSHAVSLYRTTDYLYDAVLSVGSATVTCTSGNTGWARANLASPVSLTTGDLSSNNASYFAVLVSAEVQNSDYWYDDDSTHTYTSGFAVTPVNASFTNSRYRGQSNGEYAGRFTANLAHPAVYVGVNLWYKSPPTINGVAGVTATLTTGAAPASAVVNIATNEYSLISSYTAGSSTRNNWGGYAGFSFSTSSTLTVVAVGRYELLGNSASHIVKLVNTSSGSELQGGSATVSMPSGRSGWRYGRVTSFELSAGGYTLLSQEALSGDLWTYDTGSNITLSTGSPIASAVINSCSGLVVSSTVGSYTWGGVNLLYRGATTIQGVGAISATLTSNSINAIATNAINGAAAVYSANLKGTGRLYNSATTIAGSALVTNANLKGTGRLYNSSTPIVGSGLVFNATLTSTSLNSIATNAINGSALVTNAQLKGTGRLYNNSTPVAGSAVITNANLKGTGKLQLSAGSCVGVAAITTANLTGSNNGPGALTVNIATNEYKLVTSHTASATRNEWTGCVGFSFNIPSTLEVVALGRREILGNSQSHDLKLVSGAGLTLGSTTVALPINRAGWIYSRLASSVTITTGKYQLFSSEVQGGDLWYDNTPNVSLTLSTGSVVDSTYQSFCSGPYIDGTALSTYVGVDLIYKGTTTIAGSALVTNANLKGTGRLYNSSTPIVGSGLVFNATLTSTSLNSIATNAINGVASISTANLKGIAALATPYGTKIAYSTPVLGYPLRTDYPGLLGNTFTTSVALSVTKLARWKVSGNTATHSVRIYEKINRTLLGQTTVDIPNGTAGAWVWSDLATPIAIPAGATEYGLVSYENDGGDQWHESNTVLSSNSPNIAIVNAIYTDYAITAFWSGGGANRSYVPVNFGYNIPCASSSVTATLRKVVQASTSVGSIAGVASISTANLKGIAALATPYGSKIAYSTPVLGYPLRTDYPGLLGNTFTTSIAINITRLARWKVSGNTATHSVRIYTKINRTLLGQTTVDIPNGTAGAWTWADLATPINLPAGATEYGLVSYENDGGDQWHESNTTLSSNSANIAIVNAIYTDYAITAFWSGGGANRSYVPVNFGYNIPCASSGVAATLRRVVQASTTVGSIAGVASISTANLKGIGKLQATIAASGLISAPLVLKGIGNLSAPISKISGVATFSPSLLKGTGKLQLPVGNCVGSALVNTPILKGTGTLANSSIAGEKTLFTLTQAGAVRNSFTGLVGANLTVSAPLAITALGRIKVSGSAVELPLIKVSVWNSKTATFVVQADVNLTQTAHGDFAWAAVSPAIVLTPQPEPYYLVTNEEYGKDNWYDDNTAVTVNAPTGTVCNSGIYSFSAASGPFYQYGSAGHTYVIPNLKYTLGGYSRCTGTLKGTGKLESNIAGTSLAYVIVAATKIANITNAGMPLIANFNPTDGVLRNDYDGKLGFRFKTNEDPTSGALRVVALGRWNTEGTTAFHTINVVKVNDSIIATVVVPPADNRVGWVYTYLPVPLILEPQTHYAILSTETMGGDLWYDDTPDIPFNITTGEFWYSAYVEGVVPNELVSNLNVHSNTSMFVGVNLLYASTGGSTGSCAGSSRVTGTLDNANSSVRHMAVNIAGTTTVQAVLIGVGTVSITNTKPFQAFTELSATVRNDTDGLFGCKFQVLDESVQICSLGRWKRADGAGIHTVAIYQGSTLLASTTVNLATGNAGSWVWGGLASTLELTAGNTYYLVSQEATGGDNFHTYESRAYAILSSSLANQGAYSSIDNGATWVAAPGNFPHRTFGPVNFKLARTKGKSTVTGNLKGIGKLVTTIPAGAVVAVKQQHIWARCNGTSTVNLTTSGSTGRLQLLLGSCQGSSLITTANLKGIGRLQLPLGNCIGVALITNAQLKGSGRLQLPLGNCVGVAVVSALLKGSGKLQLLLGSCVGVATTLFKQQHVWATCNGTALITNAQLKGIGKLQLPLGSCTGVATTLFKQQHIWARCNGTSTVNLTTSGSTGSLRLPLGNCVGSSLITNAQLKGSGKLQLLLGNCIGVATLTVPLKGLGKLQLPLGNCQGTALVTNAQLKGTGKLESLITCESWVYLTTVATKIANITNAGMPLIANFVPQGALRNDYDGKLGFEFKTNEDPTSGALRVVALGRWNMAGTAAFHTINLVKWNDRIIATVVVPPADNRVGWVYTYLPVPLILEPGGHYSILSTETRDGDLWYDDTPDSSFNITTGEFWYSAYVEGVVPNELVSNLRYHSVTSMYVGVNLLYSSSGASTGSCAGSSRITATLDNASSSIRHMAVNIAGTTTVQAGLIGVGTVRITNTKEAQIVTVFSNAIRNDSNGLFGCRFKVVGVPLQIYALGRWKIGGTGTRPVAIYRGNTLLASTSVNLSTGTAGSWVWSNLSSTLVLPPGDTYYYLVFDEVIGGDAWCTFATQAYSTTPSRFTNQGAYYSTDNGDTWLAGGTLPNRTYGPVNFKFTTTEGGSFVAPTLRGSGRLNASIQGVASVNVKQQHIWATCAGSSVVTNADLKGIGRLQLPLGNCQGTSTVQPPILKGTGRLQLPLGNCIGVATFTVTSAGAGKLVASLWGATIVGTVNLKGKGALAATIAGTTVVSAPIRGKTQLGSSIAGQATVTVALKGIGKRTATINGTALVTVAIKATGKLAASILGSSQITVRLTAQGQNYASSSGTSVVTATLKAKGLLSVPVLSCTSGCSATIRGIGILEVVCGGTGAVSNAELISVQLTVNLTTHIECYSIVSCRISVESIVVQIAATIVASSSCCVYLPDDGQLTYHLQVIRLVNPENPSPITELVFETDILTSDPHWASTYLNQAGLTCELIPTYTYRFQVKTVTLDGESTYTASDPVTMPLIEVPNGTSTITNVIKEATRATVYWTYVGGQYAPISFQLQQLTQDGTFDEEKDKMYIIGADNNSYTIETTSPNGYYRIRAVNNSGVGVWSGSFQVS